MSVSTTATGIGPSFFDGLGEDDVAWILSHLERREFEAGQTILAEGDAPSEIYIVESGETAVYMEDDRGNEHLLNRVGPGTTLGEMSLFTGHPVSATVRAATDLVVLVMTQTDFRRITSMFPRIYENLGAALAQRLVASNRRALREDTTRITALVDGGGPPLLAYALASSIAWHTHQPALVVVAGELDDDLAALARGEAAAPYDGHVQPRAYIAEASTLGGTLDDAVRKASTTYPHVVALLPDGDKAPAHTNRSLRLVGARDAASGTTKTEYALRAWVDPDGRRRPDLDGELRIAPLTAEDESSLRKGVLSISSPGGSAIGSAARDVADARVGVALGGGAIRGWAHIGVLDGLIRAGVPVDCIVGTSIGAIVASSYAFGHSPPETEEALYRASAKIFRLRMMRGALLSNIGVKNGLVSSFGDFRMENTPTPMAVTATDIIEQREVVLRTGLLWEGALASAAIPGVFPPMRVGPFMLVDGGVVNPVPSNVLADMGANILIGVKLTRAMTRASARARPNRIPRLIDIFTSTFELMQSKITTETAAASTLLIEPTFTESSGFGLRQFPAGRKYIPTGNAAVEAALPRLAASLPWLRQKHHTVTVS
jgi:NTE family protein